MSFDNCICCIAHTQNKICNISIITEGSLVSLSSLSPRSNHFLLSLKIIFACSYTLYKWNLKILFLCVFRFFHSRQMFLRLMYTVLCTSNSLFYCKNSIVWIYHNFPILLMMDIWIIFSFALLWIRLLWSFFIGLVLGVCFNFLWVNTKE